MVKNKVLFSVKIPALPPSVNSAVRYGRGIFYDNAKKKEFKALAIPLLREAYKAAEPYKGKCALSISLFDSTSRRWDIDNRVKVIQDCLGVAHDGAGVIADDKQIYRLLVQRFKSSKAEGPYTLVTIFEIDE